ncbi:MAG: hypothetical protein R2733_05255 [Acidimicrobiales bacterium]
MSPDDGTHDSGTGGVDRGRAGHRVSRLPLAIMAAVIAVAALVTLALSQNRSPTQYDDGTPAAALQHYIAAGLDGDEGAMLDLLAEDKRAACIADFRDDVYGNDWRADDVRTELDDMVVEGDIARATVLFREGGNSGLFDDTSWDYDRRFTLVLVDGHWLIDRAGWPYPFEDCTR